MLAFANELAHRLHKPPAYVDRIDVGDGAVTYEKEFGQAKLRHIAWLRAGLAAGRAVARILAPGWKGTGFVLRDGWLVTNWHVLPTPDVVSHSEVEFNFEEDLDGRMLPSERYRLDPATHRADERLDCACVKLIERADAPLTTWGHLELERNVGPALGDHVAIIQHPDGGPKKIAMGGNQIVNLYEHRLQYMTDTMPGSSGAPVFNDRWRVVAIHHAGGNLQRTTRGDRIYANEGILARNVSAVLFP